MKTMKVHFVGNNFLFAICPVQFCIVNKHLSVAYFFNFSSSDMSTIHFTFSVVLTQTRPVDIKHLIWSFLDGNFSEDRSGVKQ